MSILSFITCQTSIKAITAVNVREILTEVLTKLYIIYNINIFVQQVYLYDNPDPDSGYRPWLSPVERIQGEVSVFLGIPYARPPVLEGRFKVSSIVDY